MGIARLAKRSVETVKEEGIKAFLLKTRFYLKGTKGRDMLQASVESKKIFGDVLFINGCYLPHPARYRVSHQREQLLANGVVSGEVFYTDLTLDYVKRYRLFIFYRCPYTEMVGEFIRKAKSFNKKVLFDIDDLVFDIEYMDQIPYLASITEEKKLNYCNYVRRVQKTLRLCDAVITTTEGMAEELKNCVPEIFINRNTASDAMCRYSKRAVFNRDELPYLKDGQIDEKKVRALKHSILQKKKKTAGYIKIGYFSGSIIHNDDIGLILPVLLQVMKRYKNVHLYLVGGLDIPKRLEGYRGRVHPMPFVDWTELPGIIAGVDINIVPLADTLFNEVKSENKWLEASLVKVPTIASSVGALEKMIDDGKTGILCRTERDWYDALERLVTDFEYRKEIAEKAYEFVSKHCVTINTGILFSEFIKRKMTKNIGFVLPSLHISGGGRVALKHCAILKKLGYDVLVINDNVGDKNVFDDEEEINVLSTRTNQFYGRIEIAVATFWATIDWVEGYRNIGKKKYLVQGYETGFYEFGNCLRLCANQTYSLEHIGYITVSKWCETWLWDTFHQKAAYVPNGLECHMFQKRERIFGRRKIRILIEGNSDDYFKNVDESFRIVDMLDSEKYEVWFMSYQGKPKSWYRIDRFFYQIPYPQVPQIYLKCDILLKSSIMESFSYPPLEMMATGGHVVVRPNEGNVEYLRNGENCMMYEGNDLRSAVDAIVRIASDAALRRMLYENGLSTAEERDWRNYDSNIARAYVSDVGDMI